MYNSPAPIVIQNDVYIEGIKVEKRWLRSMRNDISLYRDFVYNALNISELYTLLEIV